MPLSNWYLHAALPTYSTASRFDTLAAASRPSASKVIYAAVKALGETLDFIWFDEEPPPDVYLEGLTRTNVSRGPVWLTFTPLTGVSTVVKRYLMEPSPDRNVTTMTIDDVQQLYWSLF